MRKALYTLLAVSLTLIAAHSVRANSLTYEGFDYPGSIDQTVGGLNGGSGWAAAWASGSGAWIGTNIAGTLSYADSSGHNLAVGGNKLGVGSPTTPFATTSSPNRAMLNASSPYTTLGALAAANPTEAGTVWISFLYQHPTQAANPYFRQSNLGLFQGSGEKLDIGGPNTSATINNNLSLWSSGGAHPGGTPLQSSVPVFSANAQLIVLKLILDTTTAADGVYAWFNPADLTATPNTALADLYSASEVDISGVTTFRFQSGNANANGNNAYWFADELRIGYTPFDVMLIPEPGVFCLAGLGGLALLLRLRRQK
jgi:hypothetical protein